MHQMDSSNGSQDVFIAKQICVYVINIWMQHKIETNVFSLLVSTIFSPKEGEFIGSPLFFVIITFGAFFW